MTENSLKILVCYHKPYTIPSLDDEILLPIHVGKSLSNINLGIQTDNQLNGQPCDNISNKNDTYCELTALYWAWKNLKNLYPDVKYVGLFHYRRFFTFSKRPYFDTIITPPESSVKNYRLDVGKIMNTLESGRIILAKPEIFPYPLAVQYCCSHLSDDYNMMRKIIKTKFPDYYHDFFELMELGNKLPSYNMFIMKFEDFAKYCQWVFSVLSEFEQSTQNQGRNDYQKRVFGFMSERLLNVYIRKNKLRPVYSSVYFYGGEKVGNRGIIRRALRQFITNFTFAMYLTSLPGIRWKIRKIISAFSVKLTR